MSKSTLAERPYESLFICPVDAPQKNIDAFIEKIKSSLIAEKANVKSVQVWGRRRLTYPIKRHKDGLYIYMDFDGIPKTIEVLNNLYRVSDVVLRHLTCIREDAPPVPASSTVAAPAAPATSQAPESESKSLPPQ